MVGALVGRRPGYGGAGRRRRLQPVSLCVLALLCFHTSDGSPGEAKSRGERGGRFYFRFTALLLQVNIVQLSPPDAAAVAVHVGGVVPDRGPRAVQLVLGFAAAGSLSLASPGGPNKAGLRLRRLTLHHVLRHEHSGGSLLGNTVDLTVNEDHDDSRGEEGHEAGGQDVPRLVIDETLLPPGVALLLRPQILLLLLHEERRGGDDDRNEPHDADHHFNPLRRPFAVVADGFGDGPVAVEADGAEVDDGGSAKEDVQSQVEGAPGGTKVPVAHDLERGNQLR